MKANWFVGLPVGGAWAGTAVPPPPPEVRTFHPDDLHLTVAFLGPCGEERALRGWSALGDPGPAIDVTLGEVVPMGNPRRFSALFCQAGMDSPATRACGARRRAMSITPEFQPPSPETKSTTPRARSKGSGR